MSVQEELFSSGQITITPQLISVGSKSYAVTAVNSVSVIHRPAKWTGGSVLSLAIGLMFTAMGLLAAAGDGAGAGMPLFILGVCLVFVGLGLRKAKRTDLNLSMASGAVDVLTDEDFNFLNKLKSHIETAIAMASRVTENNTFIAVNESHGDTKVCPRCAESIKLAAVVCRFCGHSFEKVNVIEG